MLVCDCCLENGNIYKLEEAVCCCSNCSKDLCSTHTVWIEGDKYCNECALEME